MALPFRLQAVSKDGFGYNDIILLTPRSLTGWNQPIWTILSVHMNRACLDVSASAPRRCVLALEISTKYSERRSHWQNKQLHVWITSTLESITQESSYINASLLFFLTPLELPPSHVPRCPPTSLTSRQAPVSSSHHVRYTELASWTNHRTYSAEIQIRWEAPVQSIIFKCSVIERIWAVASTSGFPTYLCTCGYNLRVHGIRNKKCLNSACRRRVGQIGLQGDPRDGSGQARHPRSCPRQKIIREWRTRLQKENSWHVENTCSLVYQTRISKSLRVIRYLRLFQYRPVSLNCFSRDRSVS